MFGQVLQQGFSRRLIASIMILTCTGVPTAARTCVESASRPRIRWRSAPDSWV
jgi:hypothetical protein